MNNAIAAMLAKYNPKTNQERENAIKEILQEIALAGLSRGGFFDVAAFYGGTCLRIFHGLNRFSEDLDFALLQADPSFRLDHYFPYLEDEFLSYGIDVVVEGKNIALGGDIQSAFLKGNTMSLLMSFFPKSDDARSVIPNQKTKIKFEIDTDNPSGGTTEIRYKSLPTPYEVRVFDEPTLFAGKIHAILCREYAHHVKGRDYYDYLFYVGKGSKINLKYLENKLKNTGKIRQDTTLDLNMVQSMLKDRFANTNYESAKEDVSRFIASKDGLSVWGEGLFLSTLQELKAE